MSSVSANFSELLNLERSLKQTLSTVDEQSKDMDELFQKVLKEFNDRLEEYQSKMDEAKKQITSAKSKLEDIGYQMQNSFNEGSSSNSKWLIQESQETRQALFQAEDDYSDNERIFKRISNFIADYTYIYIKITQKRSWYADNYRDIIDKSSTFLNNYATLLKKNKDAMHGTTSEISSETVKTDSSQILKNIDYSNNNNDSKIRTFKETEKLVFSDVEKKVMLMEINFPLIKKL